MSKTLKVRHTRALFISDVHLGMKAVQIGPLLEFLEAHDAETIYLVGDLLDGWRLQKSWRWPKSYNALVQALLSKAKGGARIIYLPGNHDEFLRDYLGTYFGDIEIADKVIHHTADGKRYLIIHGDQFDVVVRHAKWLAHLGDWAYNFALRANIGINLVRRRLGFDYWSLSAWAKHKVKNAVSFISRYEQALSLEASRTGVDGVICGHIHHADIHNNFGTHYINIGDWVESCTAVVENYDGSFELIRWREEAAGKKATKVEDGERAVA